ncbi:RNA-directed DNA polymerase, eukaryota, reverse transcriptase zinc-binding domain protein [Tanacetum coccineum]
MWIKGCLKSSMGSVLINGSLSSEFQFFKWLKQGDPLSPFLFIMVMESLHISFSRIMQAGLFSGISINDSLQLSRLFYVDDAVFVEEWNDSNLATIVHVLKCFFLASSLKINVHKSKLMSTGVGLEEVSRAANIVGCSTLSSHFSYLGVKDKVLVSKQKGGLEVSSLFALNRALLFKWVWLFISKDSSLWSRCIQAFHGTWGSLDFPTKRSLKSLWLDIIKEVEVLKNHGIDLMAYCSKRVGNGEDTSFWEDVWMGDSTLKINFPRLYVLETCKNIYVADKLRLDSIDSSFRRMPRGGNGEFSVKSVRNLIDDSLLSSNLPPTRWVKEIPIKINVFAWNVQKDKLPTRFNLSRVGIDIQSIVCPICEVGVETVDHLLFSCPMAREVLVKLKRWWNISSPDFNSYDELFVWFSGLHLRKERKKCVRGYFLCDVVEDLEISKSNDFWF